MAGDVMDAHIYVLPIDLLFCKLLYRAAIHLLSLPTAHPLTRCMRSASWHKAKSHLSPIHHLMNFAALDPKDVETISPVRRSPGYNPVFKTVVPPSKEVTLPFAILTNETSPVRVYSNGSEFEGGIGAHQTELFPSSFHCCVTASQSTLGYHQTCNQHTSSLFHGQPIILRLFSYCSIGSLDGRLRGLCHRQTLDIGLSDAHKYRTWPYLRTGRCWLVPIGFWLLLAMSTNTRDKNSGRLIQR